MHHRCSREENEKGKHDSNNVRPSFSSITALRPHSLKSSKRSKYYYLNLQRTNGTWAEELEIPDRFNNSKFIIFKTKSNSSSYEIKTNSTNEIHEEKQNYGAILKHALDSVMSLVGTAFFPLGPSLPTSLPPSPITNKTYDSTSTESNSSDPTNHILQFITTNPLMNSTLMHTNISHPSIGENPMH